MQIPAAESELVYVALEAIVSAQERVHAVISHLQCNRHLDRLDLLRGVLGSLRTSYRALHSVYDVHQLEVQPEARGVGEGPERTA